MAADKITIDLDLNARKAQREVAALQKKIDALGRSMTKGFGGIGGGGSTDKVRALGTGLSKATVRADEFTKSLEASNARVIAFGASAGLIMQVDKALKAMVTSAIQVEKAMMDVNVVMNANAKTLDQFGKGMFKVAKETAQGFGTVAEAATELARQGLGMEKTLTRTKDALILTRLTGMNAADAVKSLTAAVNSFNKEGVTSAQVVNRMAKVDAAFAVSSEDLAKSIARVGASAQSAGVSMNELMAITTAVQQRTARGGAVIGNAFKTIFTRIQRTDVQQKLENIGVATRDMNGEMLSGIQVLQNLAKNFNTLTKSQQASTAESVAGVFQVNILKSALGDLAQQNSAYAGALRAASSATDEAYQKNEKLNQTLDALVNRTLANLTKAGSSLGGDLFGPAINNALGAVNGIIEAFGEGGKLEKFGEGLGKDMLQGLGKFIGGPGLILITAAFGKLALNLGKFASTALKDFMGLNAAVKQRAALEDMVIKKLQSEPALISQIATGERTIASVQKDILNTMKLQTAERAQQTVLARQLASGMYSAGARVTPSGFGAFGRGRPGKAGGFVPNFANAGAERAAAAAGGYRAGAIRTMNQPGAGTMMYNSAETVKQFPGMAQKAIMPPQNSPAGAGYKAAFGAAHGFNPYAAGGFVPNFAPPAIFAQRAATIRSQQFGMKGVTGLRDPKTGQKSKSVEGPITPKKRNEILAAGGHLATNKIAMLVPHGRGPTGIGHSAKGKAPFQNFSASFPVYEWSPERVRLEGKKKGQIADASEMMLDAAVDITKTFAAKVRPPSDPKIIKNDNTRSRLLTTGGGKGAIDGAAGAVFEAGMALALGMQAAAQDTGKNRGDFDLRPRPFGGNAPTSAWGSSMSMFGGKFSMADFKISASDSSTTSMVSKIAKELVYKGPGARLIRHTPGTRMGSGGRMLGTGKAGGFIPNFSPLTSAISREMAAGVPASAIRVGSSPALRSAGNPGGVGVYNTIHEPAGLNQGINRSRAAGVDPKTHGVPNFAAGAAVSLGSRLLGFGKSAGKTAGGLGGMMVGSNMYSSDNAMTRILGSGAMGVIGGVPGVIGGLAIGALSEGIAMLTSSSDDATEAIKAQAEAQKEASDKAAEAAGTFAELAERLSAAEFVAKKGGIVDDLMKANPGMKGTREEAALKAAGRKDFAAAKAAFTKRVTQRSGFRNASAVLAEGVKAQNFVVGEGRFRNKLTDLVKNNPKLNENFTMDPERGLSSRGASAIVTGITSAKDLKSQRAALAKQFPNNPELLAQFDAEANMQLVKQGQEAASRFLSSVEGTAIGPKARRRSLIEQGKNFSRIVPGRTVEATRAGVGAAVGEIGEDFDIARQKFADALEEAGLTQKQQNISLMNFDRAITRGYNDREAYNKLQAEVNEEKQKEIDEQKSYNETILKAMQAQEVYRQSVHEAQRALGKMTRDAAQERAMFGLASGLRIAQAGARQDSLGVASVVRKEARSAAELERENAVDIADKALEVGVMEGLKGMDAVKFIEGGGFGGEEAGKALDAFTNLRDSIELGSDQEQIDSLIKRLAGIKGMKLEKGIMFGEEGTANQVGLKELQNIINTLRSSQEKYNKAIDAATEGETNAKNLAEEQFRVTKESIKLQYELNTAKRAEQRAIKASLAAAELEEAKSLMKSGRLGARGRNAAFSASLAADIANKGIQKGDVGRAFRAGFINEFGYSPVDELEDFENGSRQVAQTMKSSFAEAFRSITSGASTAGEAIAMMAQNVLDSISQVSSNMFANMMFAQMGGGRAQGGYVPGYNSGGLIVGGSGYKDDVPIRATGGEFVIKKSAVNKIGVPTLNAINGMANGGMSMGKVGMIAAGASAASGLISAAMQPGAPDPVPSQNYGFGRSKHGYLGGADPDARGADMIRGGGGRAGVSLNKAYVYYRRDPQTGQLISERARPTEGRFEVSDRLSLLGRLAEDDPQTARMFEKEQAMSSYQGYLAQETARRRAAVKAVQRQKRGRLIQAYANAAMLIGGAHMMDKFAAANTPATDFTNTADPMTSTGMPQSALDSHGGTMNYTGFPAPDKLGSHGMPIGIGRANGGMIATMGGEYIMSPEAVRTHGINFMTELNRGNVPGYASGGLVGSAPAAGGGMVGGSTTNNVSINVNIDKNGKATAEGSATSEQGGPSERDQQEEVKNNKELGEVLQGVVLQEIVRQQRPGGLLNRSTTGVS